MRIFSGIQPTGTIHLGNYFGALQRCVSLQDEGHECFFSIVDQHALTLPQDPQKLSQSILHGAALLFALGIDPEKSTVFVQSDVPEHSQLAWILSCLAPMGIMERMIQFKEKTEKEPERTTVGLFSYPILQTADIMLYKTERVPVGKDQDQHLELARILIRKFNTRFNTSFPEPQTLSSQVDKIVGLDGTAKMSKSKDNYIGLTQTSDVIWEKLRTAATDPARVTRNDPGNPYICNIYKLHTLYSSSSEIDNVIKGCQTAKIGCIDCKKTLFKNLDSSLRPIRERYHDIIKKPDRLRESLRHGAQKARTVAAKTLQEVHQAIGLSY